MTWFLIFFLGAPGVPPIMNPMEIESLEECLVIAEKVNNDQHYPGMYACATYGNTKAIQEQMRKEAEDKIMQEEGI